MALFDWLFGGGSEQHEERRAERVAFEARLRNPQWTAVEAALGHAVPNLLREIYADQALITSADLLVLDPAKGDGWDGAWNVNQFTPADAEALAPELESIPPGAFSFASNEFGDPFYVQLGELADGDGRVFVHYHDGDYTELVAPSLRTFLGWRRQARLDRGPAS